MTSMAARFARRGERRIHTESIGRWKHYEAHLGAVPAGAGA